MPDLIPFDYSSSSEMEENVEKINRGYFRFNQQTESQMFLNANELYQADKTRSASTSSLFSSRAQQQMESMKGAIVLSHSKELVNQIYVQSRQMDTSKRILMNRATSSLQMKSPIVEFITPDIKKGEREYSDDELFNISLYNVINNASWKISDILFSTPIVMSHILDSKGKYNPLDINPKTIIIDEFDELLQSNQLQAHIVKLLKKF